MQFHLVYSGPLPAGGNKSKPDQVRVIRDKLHPQLEYLWQTHTALKRLRSTAVVVKVEGSGKYLAGPESPFDPEFDASMPVPKGHVDLCEPLSQNGHVHIPLVRKSLDLNCSLDIPFLRQEDPGNLVLQGGDIDNRIKTLFDALTMPKPDNETKYPQRGGVTYSLLESDSLISGVNVSTDRLLFPTSEKPDEVHLTIQITVRVLKLGSWNVCLMGA